MNETKRQLNRYMGDTTERTKEVMKMVERNKGKHIQKKKRSLAPLYGIIATVVALFALLFTIGPLKPDQQASPPAEVDQEETTQQNHAESYRQLFKKDGIIAYFVGDGNEYANLREKTIWVNENYVIVRVDNGGAITDRVFRIGNEKLALISTGLVNEMNHEYTLKELEAMPELEVLFEGLIENGTTPNGDTVTTNVTFETPFKTFTDAIVTKRLEDDGSTNETAYVAGYGIVGMVFTSNDGYKVTSLLNAMSTEEQELAEEEGMLAVYNTTTKQTELFKFTGLDFVDTATQTEAELREMNIRYEVLANTSSSELGLFTYLCDLYGCGYSIVLRKSDEVKMQFSSYGHIPTIVSTEPYITLKLSKREFGPEESNIERNNLFLFDTKTEESIIPKGAHLEHFKSQTWPITEVAVENSGILTYKVADIANANFETIKNWQMSDKPVKEFNIDLTQ